MKWRELKKLGVRRCGAMFVSGKQCRRRAIDVPNNHPGWGYCAKHGGDIMSAVKFFNRTDEEGK